MHTYTHAHTHRAHLLQSEVADPMRNPFYEKSSSVLHITVTALNITLWKQLYLRTDAETTLSISGFEAIKQLKDTNTALKSTLETVRKWVSIYFQSLWFSHASVVSVTSNTSVSKIKLLLLTCVLWCWLFVPIIIYYSELEQLQVEGRKYASNWT